MWCGCGASRRVVERRGSCAPRAPGGRRGPGDIDDLVFLPELVDSDKVDGLRTLKLGDQQDGEGVQSEGEMLAATDLRVGTTASLVRALTETVGSAVQLPNGYDDDGWRNSQEALANVRNDGVIRIGYAGGSLTHQKDLVVAAPAVARVLRENPDVRLVLFRDSSIIWNSLNWLSG